MAQNPEHHVDVNSDDADPKDVKAAEQADFDANTEADESMSHAELDALAEAKGVQVSGSKAEKVAAINGGQ